MYQVFRQLINIDNEFLNALIYLIKIMTCNFIRIHQNETLNNVQIRSNIIGDKDI
jgi:hypothetical protein